MHISCKFLDASSKWDFGVFRTPKPKHISLFQIQVRWVTQRIGRQQSYHLIHIYYLFRKINTNTQTFRGFQELERLLCPPLTRKNAEEAKWTNSEFQGILTKIQQRNMSGRIFSPRRNFCINRNFESDILSIKKHISLLLIKVSL